MDGEHARQVDGTSLFTSPRRWALWAQRPVLIAYWLLIAAITIVATWCALITVPVAASDWSVLAVLAGMGIVQAELGRQVERVRRRITGTISINMTSVWFLPAALLLPPALVAILVATLSWHLHFRCWYRLRQVPEFRTFSVMSTVLLTCYATRAAADAMGVHGIHEAVAAGWHGVATIVVCIATYFVVDAILVIPFLNITDRSIQSFIGGWADNLLELATLCLGALTAVALVVLPPVATLIVLPVVILHRAVLIDQLESATRQDDKTGIWNIAGWHRIAREELARAERRVGAALSVLMIDLDHFKRINDTHGHLAGDTILKAVAATISGVLRPGDAVGRFGGEEFVVLLPGITGPDARAVAERIRGSIARLEVTLDHGRPVRGLSASIGIATYPATGATIERLLQAADSAMYRAKATGRNRVVHIGDPVPSGAD
ncbi:MAG TPA: GGDEF domain-containing protein [Actinophytocola sp.]|uniref:GGDEF domain-containing protein n=1 Tax=Actinophytocola sp. TaxID=1872138 RepID=UPI002DDD805B|nr:GGDEF domain-containing protein [Actinophytocola sp.]HEV2783715.1 GGDEF domain-containing protein [Actinophytocola sp.]